QAKAPTPERRSRPDGPLSAPRTLRPEAPGRHVLPLPRPRAAGRHLALPPVAAAGPPALLGAALRCPVRSGHRRRQLLRLRRAGRVDELEGSRGAGRARRLPRTAPPGEVERPDRL